MLRVARCECLSYAVSDASASRLAVQKCCVYTVAVSGYIVALFCGFGYDNLWVLVSAAHCRYCWRQSVSANIPGGTNRAFVPTARLAIFLFVGILVRAYYHPICSVCVNRAAYARERTSLERRRFPDRYSEAAPPPAFPRPRSLLGFRSLCGPSHKSLPRPSSSVRASFRCSIIKLSSVLPPARVLIVLAYPPPRSGFELKAVTFRLLLCCVLFKHFYRSIGKVILFVNVPIEKIFQ